MLVAFGCCNYGGWENSWCRYNGNWKSKQNAEQTKKATISLVFGNK